MYHRSFGALAIAATAFYGLLGCTQYAYVANWSGGLTNPDTTPGTVSVISGNSLNATISSGIGITPEAVCVDWLGSTVFVANLNSNTVSVIDAQSRTVEATFKVGTNPQGLALTPGESKLYVANQGSNNVSVIQFAIGDLPKSTVSTISSSSFVGPAGVAVSPDSKTVYVTNSDYLIAVGGNSVSLIDTATNKVVGSPINVGSGPTAAAATPDGSKVYVVNLLDGTVSVIDTKTKMVSHTITVGTAPQAAAVTPDSSKVYVTNLVSNTVSVIDTKTDKVTKTIMDTSFSGPGGVAVTPDGSTVYVANVTSDVVSVINTKTDTVTAPTIPISGIPVAIGTPGFVPPPGV